MSTLWNCATFAVFSVTEELRFARAAEKLHIEQSPLSRAIKELEEDFGVPLEPAADLLFELVSRRYQNKSTVVTTNRAFAEWGEVFSNAACVASLIDRLMHRAEVIRIQGESYRKKEADEREAARQTERAARQSSNKPPRAGARRPHEELRAERIGLAPAGYPEPDERCLEACASSGHPLNLWLRRCYAARRLIDQSGNIGRP